MSRFMQELNGELGAYWKKSAEEELAEVRADLDAGRITIDENGICKAVVDENQLKGISTYGGQQLEVDWKTDTRKLCDITFRVLLILHYANGGKYEFCLPQKVR